MKRGMILAVAMCAIQCDSVPNFSTADIESAPLLAHAPKGFLLGAASAPHQVEGGLNDDWTLWEQSPVHIKDHSNANIADNSWYQWQDDIAALKTLGVNTYRFGIDWSRLEPTQGQFDASAEAKYELMLRAMKAAGIQPIVTLYHFTLPQWVSNQGGWAGWPGAPQAFADFAGHVAARFGQYVDIWCTINEPNVLVTKGYIQGVWPPGLQDQKQAGAALAQLMKAHALAAAAIRANDTVDADDDGKATRIGFALHVAIFQAATTSPLDQAIAELTDQFFNEAFPDAIESGQAIVSIPGAVSINEAVPGLKGSIDWLGINYYTRYYVRADLSNPSLSIQFVPNGRPENTLDWDIYPEGMYRALVRFGRYGWPIIVTENGVADPTDNSDTDVSHRPFFLKAHLYAMDKAMQQGVNVQGYIHWCLMDNFEWAEGFTAQFGLFSIDYAHDPTLARTPRPVAVAEFQAAARAVGLTPGD